MADKCQHIECPDFVVGLPCCAERVESGIPDRLAQIKARYTKAQRKNASVWAWQNFDDHAEEDVGWMLCEVERLQGLAKRLALLVQDAYEEGWQDGMHAGNCQMPDWQRSDACAALSSERVQ